MKIPGRVAAYHLLRIGGVLLVTSWGVFSSFSGGAALSSAAGRCALTQGGFGAPDYKPNPPVRSHVGTGFVLTGTVRSGIDCSGIPRARVEFWLRGPDGLYDDAHRGTVITDGSGRYRFESNFPGGDGGFQPHIHLRIAVSGYHTLVTVYLPHAGASAGSFDLVLEPEM